MGGERNGTKEERKWIDGNHLRGREREGEIERIRSSWYVIRIAYFHRFNGDLMAIVEICCCWSTWPSFDGRTISSSGFTLFFLNGRRVENTEISFLRGETNATWVNSENDLDTI